MNIHRGHLALPVLAIGLLGVVPAFAASADEDAVAKNVEAFRTAQLALDVKALDALCAAELSYSHSDGRVMDKATFITDATNRKTKTLSLVYENPTIRVVGTAAIVRFHWMSDSEVIADGKKALHQSPHPDELAKTGRGLEASIARGNQALIVSKGSARDKAIY